MQQPNLLYDEDAKDGARDSDGKDLENLKEKLVPVPRRERHGVNRFNELHVKLLHALDVPSGPWLDGHGSTLNSSSRQLLLEESKKVLRGRFRHVELVHGVIGFGFDTEMAPKGKAKAKGRERRCVRCCPSVLRP